MKEESNLIIYIIGLILLIIWKVTAGNSTFETRLEELAAAAINRIRHLSSRSFQLSSLVNVFGESVGSGSVDLQLVKKVVATVGQYEEYWAEINQSYVLGFPPYRLHTTVDGIFVTPIRYYDGRVYVFDDVASMDVAKRKIVGDNGKLIYFVEADDGSGVARQGDRGPAGKRGAV